MDRIRLAGMRFEGRHGVSAEERELPQLIEVHVELEVDLDRASRSDSLSDTVDYGPLIEIARRTVEEGSFALLEAIAGALAAEVLAAAPLAGAVSVRVRKLAVPVEADIDHAEVELRRTRPGATAPAP